MKLSLLLALPAVSAFSFGQKKAPAKAAATKSTRAAGTVETPSRWKWGFGDYGAIADRADARAAKIEAEKANLIPTPPQFLFALGRPDVLAERSAARQAKWEWSSEFLSKARPDYGNYGAGDYFDDGLTTLERAQIQNGKDGFLTGAAKLRYNRLNGKGIFQE